LLTKNKSADICWQKTNLLTFADKKQIFWHLLTIYKSADEKYANRRNMLSCQLSFPYPINSKTCMRDHAIIHKKWMALNMLLRVPGKCFARWELTLLACITLFPST
jgi:hypothetical protein